MYLIKMLKIKNIYEIVWVFLFCSMYKEWSIFLVLVFYLLWFCIEFGLVCFLFLGVVLVGLLLGVGDIFWIFYFFGKFVK